MVKKEGITLNKKVIQEAKKRHRDAIDTWKKNLEEAIITSYNHIKKYPNSSEKKFESVKLLLKDGLALLEDRTYKENFSEGREIFYYMKDAIAKKESKAILSNEIDKYRQDLALRGGLLAEKAHLKMDFVDGDAKILHYYDKYFGNRSPILEKSITIVSLLSILLGIFIGYPALTGNLIAETVNGSLAYGAILFFVGLLGVFLANKR
ncbi:MAG TPA: hypothetical protein PLE51_01800 [Candidatus Pacearchaeota archaeon]|nr:hypothetical protein [Candidatus Pacearchaeota archaeon]HOR52377.1 hypothetical protein [Candidatus Pacearchaeota archaeon]HOU78902.1 hypothetical protein [Candidatus Pacearchaeota archaeon]HPJ86570.1 hypothetical protein [Candidatus Pacearchaeota archaeon]HQF82638.1 hypothetical protein [Candidatus Pacearchaeota archaeon]